MFKVVFFIFLFCCASNGITAQDKERFVVEGSVQGLKDGTKVYLTRSSGRDTVTMSMVSNESFVFNGEVPLGTDFYYIKLDTLVSIQPSKALLLVNNIIKIKGTIANWPQLDVTGSEPHNEYIEVLRLFAQLNVGLSNVAGERSKVYTALFVAQNKGDSLQADSLVREGNDLVVKEKELIYNRDSIVKGYIEHHLSSLYIADLIRKMEPAFKLSGMQELYDKLTPRAKGSYFGMALYDRLKVGEIKAGDVAIDFTGKTPEGIDLSLKDILRKGKFTLLDFWASWCKPCRQENPNVRKAYDLYHKKGLNILSITLDTNLDDWRKAIRKDTMSWYHVVDNKEGILAKSYNVTGVPATFLLDKNGKVIASGLRGERLISRLNELMKD